MEYYATVTGTVPRDELFSDGVPVRIENVSLSGGAERGMILGSAAFDSVFTAAADVSVKNGVMVVAAEDVDDTGTVVTSAYTSGSFHAGKLKVAGAFDVSDLKENLRRENIIISE